MASILNIESRREADGRSLEDYRAARQKKKITRSKSPALPRVEMDQPKIGGVLKDEYDEWLKQDISQHSRRGLIPSTILEEDDSSENGF